MKDKNNKKFEKNMAQEKPETKRESTAQSTTCKNGVCTITWKPQRPAA